MSHIYIHTHIYIIIYIHTHTYIYIYMLLLGLNGIYVVPMALTSCVRPFARAEKAPPAEKAPAKRVPQLGCKVRC